MADEIGARAGQPDALNPSRFASVATLLSAAVGIAGVVGQLSVHGSVGFAVLGGFGFAVLAAIVLVHQR